MTLADILQLLTPVLVVIGFGITALRRKDDRIETVVAGVARLEALASTMASDITARGIAHHDLVRRVGEIEAATARDLRELHGRVAVIEDRTRRP